MFISKEKENNTLNYIKEYLKNKTFHRILIGIITILIAFVIIDSGATPKRYKLSIGNISSYNITATYDIEDKSKTETNAKAAVAAVIPVMIEIKGASIDVLNSIDDFITMVEDARKSIDKNFQDLGITKTNKNYKNWLTSEQDVASNKLGKNIDNLKIHLSTEQVKYLVAKATDEDINNFKNITRNLISNAMKQDITSDNLANQVYNIQKVFQIETLSQDLKNIGNAVVSSIIKPNKTINTAQTQEKINEARNNPKNKEMILKGKTIINSGDTVTTEKYRILKDLNLLEESQFDYLLAIGILAILLLLALMLILYMNHFCKKILQSKNNLLLLSVVILLILLISRGIYEYSPLLIPTCIAAMLISILLDLKLAIMVNFVLSIAISFITKGDLTFIYMSMISGTFSAFIVSGTNQRNKLFMTGVFIAFINVIIVVCFGIIYKSELSSILSDSAIASLNGILSIILTIGMLPFWESAFNIITPLKLLELANPNQPLLKRLLMEAPGTYHHSLMVGNLAEVATEAIGGNSLLARAGAYFHDIGKLKRPNFFKENQLSDNPHDRMTANLSTLVITSHTQDGAEIAQKYKVPMAVREIISQHHGTTLVAYFYHKAKKGEKGDDVKQDNFRYEGPKPASKEAAVVMLADSVEAAVRSMIDKTEGKIEGLVRKIIKDKLDDGQLELCNLTLKDLDEIAKEFMKVLSGYFHEREEYPEIKSKQNASEEITAIDGIEKFELKQPIDEERISSGNIN